MARMLEAGRRPASWPGASALRQRKTWGNADPMALVLANAAFQTCEFIGMPEARILLAQAVTYIASAPKSNASYTAIDAAIADVREGKTVEVPQHLMDAHYKGAKTAGPRQRLASATPTTLKRTTCPRTTACPEAPTTSPQPTARKPKSKPGWIDWISGTGSVGGSPVLGSISEIQAPAKKTTGFQLIEAPSEPTSGSHGCHPQTGGSAAGSLCVGTTTRRGSPVTQSCPTT